MRNTLADERVIPVMRTRLAVVIAANAVILLATNVAFRAWVSHRFGYVDPDIIGTSGQLWPLLVVVAIASVALGSQLPAMRLVAVGLTVVLGFIVIDHAVGALRDGQVSVAGMTTGVFMVIQVVGLAIGAAIVHSRSQVLVRAATVLLGGVTLAIAIGTVGSVNRVSGAEPKQAAVQAWLDALAIAESDRGWSHLDGQTARQTTRERYVADAGRVDWSTVTWRVEPAREREGFWSVDIALEEGSDATLDFFFDHELARPLCLGTTRIGIGVMVETPLIGQPMVGSGPRTGRQERGSCGVDPIEVPPSPVKWSDEPAWTGVSLEVFNRTTTDLFMLDRAGVRVELPACGHVATSALDLGHIEVRAVGGYVFAFGGDRRAETTTFVVVMADEPDMNGAPPREPLPPCEGQPQVQSGE